MIELRLPSKLHTQMFADLERLHPFAFERVGFLYARPDVATGKPLVMLAIDYLSIPDNGYVRDDSVGARINSGAIRAAMQHTLTTGLAAFHVHLHAGLGAPGFSSTDKRESARLMPSFRGVANDVPHGAIIFTSGGACGNYWFGSDPIAKRIKKITVVGFPMRIYA
jgi:hypothetical protein